MAEGYWGHEKFMDMFCEVVASYSNAEVILATVYWWNKGFSGKPWQILPEMEVITINIKDFHKWHKFPSLKEASERK